MGYNVIFDPSSWRHPRRLAREVGLWRGMAWGIMFVAVWDGAGYFSRGNVAAQGDTLTVLKNLPGGMHTHGAIMLGLALLISYAMHDRPILASRVMLAVFVYSIYISVAIVAGWILSSSVAWSAPSKWFLVAWVSLWLSVTTENMKSMNEGQ